MDSQELSKYYNAYYYRQCCGAPWEDRQAWEHFLGDVADHILRDIHPTTVLDAGCGFGLLVALLRQRGIAAYGIDISEHALQNLFPEAQPYCQLGSITGQTAFTVPFPENYDLILCIEVLEHLSPREAEFAIANLCQHTRDIIFSSSPFDYTEATHLNVQPPETWAALFAGQGFYRDTDFDASFVSHWAARWRRLDEPSDHLLRQRIVRQYERKFFPLWKENLDLRRQALEMQQKLAYNEQIIRNLTAQLESTNPANQANPLAPSAAPNRVEPVEAGPAATENKQTEPAQTHPSILVISHDIIGARMAGPGIRYYHLSRILSREFDITLAVPSEPDPAFSTERLHLVQYEAGNWATLEPFVHKATAILTNGYVIFSHLQFYTLDIPIIVDAYDPLWAEWLEAALSTPEELFANWRLNLHRLIHQYLVGDFFIVASERQRDWCLGLLENAGRVNPWTYSNDPSLRNLLDVVPFGLPEEPPQHTRPVIRGVWQGIGEQDKIILWGGGLWLWLDPITAIRAVAKIQETRQDIRLIFPGAQRPVAGFAHPPTHFVEAQDEAQRLGLLNKAVFFEDWIDYQDWPNVLLESDLALTLHCEDTLEARLAFRTRLLDCIWSGLPAIATAGDITSEMVERFQMGTVIAARDTDGLAQAILEILDTPREVYRQRAAAARPQLTWEKAAGPLLQFFRNPHRAPDKPFLGKRVGYPYYLDETLLAEDNVRLHAFLGQALHEKDNLSLDNQRLQLQIDEAQQENARLQSILQAFENRRIVRLLNWLVQLRKRWLGR